MCVLFWDGEEERVREKRRKGWEGGERETERKRDEETERERRGERDMIYYIPFFLLSHEPVHPKVGQSLREGQKARHRVDCEEGACQWSSIHLQPSP